MFHPRPGIGRGPAPAGPTRRSTSLITAGVLPLFTFVTFSTPSLWAQGSAVSQQLHVEGLLELEAVLAEELDDPVWTYETTPGQRLLQVPIRLDFQQQAEALRQPAIEVRPGRFIAWRIPAADEEEREAEEDRPRGRIERGVLEEAGYGEEDRRWGPQEDDQENQAPRVARTITLPGDGTVKYPLERAIPPGGEVKEGTSIYMLALRRDRLTEMKPDRSAIPRQEPGEDRREFMRRRMEAQAEMMEAQQEFLEALRAVNQVPSEFVAEDLEYVFGIYEVPSLSDTLTIQGPAPLPWEIDLELLESLRDVVNGERRMSQEDLGRDEWRMIQGLLDWTEDGHPLTLRTAAVTLRASGWMAMARTDGPIYDLMKRIINGPDEAARAEVVGGLASIIPPTPASARLLRESAGMLTPQLRMASLENLFSARTGSELQSEQLVETAQDVLDDPEAPPADEVVAEMIEASAGNPEAIAALLRGVTFDTMPQARRNAAVEQVIKMAGRYELARRWVNDRMLGGNDPAVIDQALNVLRELEVDHDLAAERRRQGGRFDAMPEAEPGDAIAPIPVLSSRHGLFDQLESRRASRRAAAFDALGAFTFEPVSREAASQSVMDLRYRRLLNAALELNPAPVEVVSFLGVQPEKGEAAAALIELVLKGGEPTAGVAAAALLALEADMLPILRRMTSQEQVRFASRLYLESRGEVTPVVGLLRGPGASRELLPWFANRIANGELPPPAAWADEYRNEDEVLRMAAGEDRLLARSAAGALLAKIGASGRDVDTLIRALQSAEGDDALEAAWEGFQTEVRQTSLKDAAGAYMLSFTVRGGTQAQRTIEVGEITLVESDAGLAFANAALPISPGPEPMQLAIEKPAELKGLAGDQLDDLPLENLGSAWMLDPAEGGGWIGQAALGDGRELIMRLEPRT